MRRFSRRQIALPALIVLLAFGLRVWAIGWGLPYADHPDEPAVSNVALGMLKRGDWDPRTFVYPSLYYNLLRATFTAHWAFGKSRGLYADMAQLPATTDVYVTVPGFFIWGRLLTLALGVLTVGLALLIGWRWLGERAGLLGGLLLAILPYHMRHSQYITTDVATGLTALLALGGALLVLDSGSWRRYALAGFAAGLAAGTKYNAGAVVLALSAAHGLHWGRASLRQFRRLPWAALWSLLGFVATTPYAALHFAEFMRTGPTAVLAHYGAALHGDVIGSWPVGAYLDWFWREGLQPLPFLAMLFGAWTLWRRRSKPALVLAAFVVPSTLLALSQPMHFFRNLLPVLPPLCLVAGAGAAEAAELAAAWL
ncbi:MAG TPA: glycosyltransferase family 39 protein, partial [Herpetosiphonaceae bacterium]